MKRHSVVTVVLVISSIIIAGESKNLQYFKTEEELQNFLQNDYEEKATLTCNKVKLASWNFATYTTNAAKEEAQLTAILENARFNKEYWQKYFKDLNPDDYQNETLRRQVQHLRVVGAAALNNDKLANFTTVLKTMVNIYSTTKICPFKRQVCEDQEMLSLEPDVVRTMATSNNYAELEYLWSKWRDLSGAKIKNLYKTYVQLSNEAAMENKFNDMGKMWLDVYESPTFIKDIDKLWAQIEPLYYELHRYTRKKLKERYRDEIDVSDGFIPAHVLGDMWAESWSNLYPLLVPFSDANMADITSALKQQNYTVLKMFAIADEFYQSLGFSPYDTVKGAMLESPKEGEVACQASAWEFCDGENFKIKMCGKVDCDNFLAVHRELGHIQYYLQYKNQPISLRLGANPAFDEAIGDAVALSVTTPKHLEAIGLLKDYNDTPEASINVLMDTALKKVASLPFSLLMDKWRWDVFAGEVNPKDWNSHWWNYRKSIQKVKPPMERQDSNFDPGANYYIAGGLEHINHFIGNVLEFQLYRGLCKLAGEYDPENDSKPLHKCDFYKSTKAGDALRAGLSLGSSKHWKEVLKAITGETDLDPTAVLEYFEPLLKYLKKENGLTEEELEALLKEYEPEASTVLNKLVIAEWDFATDVNNKEKEEAQLKATLETAKFDKEYWDKHFRHLKEENYEKEHLKRQVRVLKVLGDAALDPDKLTELTTISSYMTNTYSTAKICPYEDQQCDLNEKGLSLEPDISSIMAKSSNLDELSYAWDAWRSASGAKIKDEYAKYVELSNEAAVANGFTDKGDMWRTDYESDTFIEDMNRLWEQVKPLYHHLHKYVARKLKERYPQLDIKDGLIPAHVLGNMWAQSWINLSKLVKPYPDDSSIDVTQALKDQQYTVLKMFETSDEFYQSLGLPTNEMSYGSKAVIEKPNDREILCHASAWDFSDKHDFRIKMCTEIDYEDFITIHHEMGHIQYFIQYKDQPVAFRDGANPGFHEAVGDTIALSVATPNHLEKIDLLKDYEHSKEAAINTLMDMALERVAFLPFGLLIDKWRWDVFAGKVPKDKWNSHWWKYREEIQKVKAPVPRSDANHFDPGAKFHVPGDSQYINYFVAHILEFQLYRGLCIAANQYDPKNKTVPLNECDFYQSKEAGERLSAGLTLGSSKHWKDALEVMTGERDLDATAILEYFAPLMEYLEEQNKLSEKDLEKLLDEYNNKASVVANKQTIANWNFATDVENKQKEEEKLTATLETAKFDKFYWNEHFRYLKESDYTSEALQRQVKFLKVLGNAALGDEKLEELTNVKNEMTRIYSTGKICPYQKPDCDLAKEGLELEPDIENVVATSEDYEELSYVWKAWRDASGANMKHLYETYVKLSNEAAQANDFTDKGEMWRDGYESPTFIKDMDRLWDQVKPLYNELHRFVAKKLKEHYKEKINISDGLIPAHVLGNMWAQSWINLSPLVRPYPEESGVDISEALQKLNIEEMFSISNEFYTSLGLEDNSMSYGSKAVIEKPTNRKILCHASAWDFSDGKDFRIKMCTEKIYQDFITVHHEMGHIQYFIQYKDQPIVFRGGANPGFHEAIGDTIALSVATPKHLEEIGLLEGYKETDKAAINTLMDMALQRVAFLPFGLLIDKWRWDVFAGLPVEKWNSHWWHYRNTLQKIKAPIPRSEKDFDPGAKYHVPGDSQYINYFVAHILEFQLYRALCKAAGQYDPANSKQPLHKCDYYKSTEAGAKLSAGLKMGVSKHWKEILEVMTGEKDLDATALLDYFDPLFKYLLKENGLFNDDLQFRNFLELDYEPSASRVANDRAIAEWNYITDVANSNKQQILVEESLRAAEFTEFYYTNYFKNLKEADFKDVDNKRQIKFLSSRGNEALSPEKLKEYNDVSNEMTKIYSTARICPFDKKDDCNLETEGLTLEPELVNLMAKSRNYSELEYIWKAWRSESGAKIKKFYPKYIQLSNEAAAVNGFKNKGEMWISDYESPNLINELDALWQQVEPFYNELHKYVSRKLKEQYGDEIDVSDGLIPAHVLGNMWAQAWDNIFDLVKPFPTASDTDVTAEMIKQKYTVLKMFEMSDEFYQSLGLEPNHMSYNESLGAVIVKPNDRDILCHAQAFDFQDGKDFRIKMCTEVNFEDFITVHHEMGHIQYYILYKDQPLMFRKGTNPGFHEAIGDTIALSVATSQHLKDINLLPDYKESKEADLNTLMSMALQRVAFLPFGLLIDKWRWDVFSGEVAEKDWNSHWWTYRKTYQKIKPPVDRSEDDFDPGAKFHVAGDFQYVNYFIARILQFQLYKGLCKAAGKYDPDDKDLPLYKCDFYKSKEAGNKLRQGLQLGASKHWKEVLEIMTGETELRADALLEYFEPLYEYLKAENEPEKTSQLVPIIVGSILGAGLVLAMSFYCYKRFKR